MQSFTLESVSVRHAQISVSAEAVQKRGEFMKRKVVSMLLVMSMAAMMFGCGGKDDAESSSAAGSTPAAESTAGEETGSPVTLNVVTTYAGEDSNAGMFQSYRDAWAAETGNTVNDSSATSDETFKARVLADFETGAEPDVLFFFNGVDSNAFVESGKVVSIDEIREVYPDYAANMKDDMMGASPVDGKNYSVPVNGYWEGLFVNKAVLEAAGVEVPGADYTWDQFLEDCQKIVDAGYTPIAASLSTIPHYWFEFSIYNFLSPATHNILPETADDAHGAAWIDGLSDIKDLYEKGYFPENTLSATDDETFQMFLDGKAAFLIDGSWKTGGIVNAFCDEDGNITDQEGLDNFTVSYVPGKNDRKATDIIGGLSSGYFITRKAWDDPEKREAAVSFVSYMTSDEVVSAFAGVSATALVNGVQLDESTLNTLQIAGLEMVTGATGMAGAVQDQIPTEARVPLFDGMPDLVTGTVDIADAVAECLDLLYAE